MLSRGKQVFITSHYAGVAALTNIDEHLATEAAIAFFTDTLGLQLLDGMYKPRSASGSYTGYKLSAVAGDIIGTGLPGTMYANQSGAKLFMGVQSVYNVIKDNPNVVPFLYSDADPLNIVGLRYKNGAGARLVMYSLPLDNIVVPRYADSLGARAINWLTGALADAPQAAVTFTPAPSGSYVASPSLFHGSTDISYGALDGEHSVTFSAYDMLGREVAKLTPKISGSNYVMTFDATQLAAGSYVIVKRSSLGTAEVRVVNE
jgi:hypothetical protein